MKTRNPKVSIGLPVYNGENFVREAIDSILAQTFRDFELIISDNASTDNTEAICRAYAAQDDRVRYYRNRENVGSSGNYIRVFELASGEYFKWSAHDDVCLPTFLARCIEVLEKEPSVVLCYTRTRTIDPDGKAGKEWDPRPDLDSLTPHRRLRDILARQDTFPIWGVTRRDILVKTPLLGNYPAHDRPLLAELALYGRLYEVPEFLLLEREHEQRSVRLYDFRKPHEAVAWYDPKLAGKLIFPAWRLLYEYLAGIHRAPLSGRERLPCYSEVARWFIEHRQALLRDLIIASKRVPGIGPVIAEGHRKQFEKNWSRQVHRMAKTLASTIPQGEFFILVDEATLELEAFVGWRTVPFLERDGQYWGPPPDDRTAIQELERLRRSGARFIVFVWSTFWWFDYYAKFFECLRSKFACVLENDRLVVFDLR